MKILIKGHKNNNNAKSSLGSPMKKIKLESKKGNKFGE